MTSIPLDFNKPKIKAPKKALRFEINLSENHPKFGHPVVDFPKLVQSRLKDKKDTDRGNLPVNSFALVLHFSHPNSKQF